MIKVDPKKIVISRTDSIGDVVLTLPLAGILKKKFPNAQVIFLGNTYTKPIIQCSEHVDEVWEWAIMKSWSYDEQVEWLIEQNVDVFLHVFPRREIARIVKKANIPFRIGTSHRIYHLLTCNNLVNFTRKRSELHEAQLNTKLLAPFGIRKSYSLDELTQNLGFNRIPELPDNLSTLIDKEKQSVILHPKSQGSAIEWGVDNFMKLAAEINDKKFQVFITGTENEAKHFRDKIPSRNNVIDLSGQLTLEELIAFIDACDILVAASTGPLHIAGICNTHAVGLFSSQKPIHPGRWKPLGNKVSILTSGKNSTSTQPLQIDIRDVLKAIEKIV
ncbi:MAG: glycosyltransferase family 9 protein [Crocinitomicaceae bacterium]|nr:glycosyltransferase family 9 protein [Crocinitomicaceae bacterium]